MNIFRGSCLETEVSKQLCVDKSNQYKEVSEKTIAQAGINS
jgi:hypothetical protein